MVWMIFLKILENKIQGKMLITFNDIIADILSNKKLIATELFIRGRRLSTYFVFITQSYFAVPKKIRLNFTHFYMKIPNKRQL